MGANIVNNQEFVDYPASTFFMRTEFTGPIDENMLLSQLKNLLPEGSDLNLSPLRKPRIAILVTKEAHCLGDLLIRHRFGELDMELVGVAGNRSDLEDLVNDFHLPFTLISTEDRSREEQEKELEEYLTSLDPDLIILAKYMRILSPEFVRKWDKKILNIHHSFLPAFKGARPYMQAYERGVKVIGATAHFVTENLDEGPIVVQDVIPVDHSYDPDRLFLFGRDLEKIVLAKALRLLLERRVIHFKNRTIVFE